MNSVLIFDLDDTLYDESDYVQSGFKAVALFLEENFEIPMFLSMQTMNNLLETEGRGRIFNQLLELNGINNKTLVKKCITIYRNHHPSISLYPEAKTLLESLGNPLYLVTDGHKIVQQKKIEALNIKDFFRKTFITHRYGIINSKPSTYCFNKIRERENCSWSNMVYIGDNPIKDFINLKPLGVKTIRVLTGNHRNLKMGESYNAEYEIPDLSYLKVTLSELL